MKPALPLIVAALLLGGCPDNRLPKTPPRVPQPKAETTKVDSPAPQSGLPGDTRPHPGLVAPAA